MWHKLARFVRRLFGQGESAEPVAVLQSELVEPIKLVVGSTTNRSRTAFPMLRDGQRHHNKVVVPTRAGELRVAKVVDREGTIVTCRRLHQQKLFRATLPTV